MFLLMDKAALQHKAFMQGLSVRPHLNPAFATRLSSEDILQNVPFGVFLPGDGQ